MFFSLEGKIAVITGGSQGIGLTTAQRFKKAGAEIVILDITDATETADGLDGMAIQADVTDEASIQKAFASVVEKHGRIDVLVNNAGVGFDEPMLEEADFKLFDKVININVKGVMNCMKHVVAHMAEGGVILNVSSTAGLVSPPMSSAYNASKAAVISLTKSAAVELALKHIRVNCLVPGTVATTMNIGTPNETLAKYINPDARMCDPEEIAAAYHFLASDDARFITGASLVIDGGQTAGISLGLVDKLLSE